MKSRTLSTCHAVALMIVCEMERIERREEFIARVEE
jgi:hypothetical protein